MQTIDIEPHRNDGRGRAPEWAAARRVLAHAAPPDSVEAALLQAYVRRHKKRPWYRRWTLDGLASGAGIASVAVVLLMAVAGTLAPLPQADLAAHAPGDGFLSLATPEQIAAAVHPQLKRANLTRQALVQLGIPIASDAPDELIHAELLVAASGEPLAIRLAVN
ncbi:hypothetical protein ACLB1G_01770 [Oxalobacteraceae bacterium A2-2]